MEIGNSRFDYWGFFPREILFMKIRVWSWAFYQWYFWLIAGVVSLLGIISNSVDVMNESFYTLGLLIGNVFVLWIVFTISKYIYMKGGRPKK